MSAIVPTRVLVTRSYPASPLVAPPDGARFSTMARAAMGQASPPGAQPAGLEAGRRGAVRLTLRSAATGATQHLAQDAAADESARSRQRRANAAYLRMRDSHIQWVAGYERVDMTV